MKVFQYVAMLHPTEKEKENGATSKLIVDVKTVAAKDIGSATLAAARALPEDVVDKLDQVELVIRPF